MLGHFRLKRGKLCVSSRRGNSKVRRGGGRFETKTYVLCKLCVYELKNEFGFYSAHRKVQRHSRCYRSI